MLKSLKYLALAAVLSSPAYADGLGLGRVATPEEVAAWDQDVRPDGLGLPAGKGNATDGEEIFAEKCAVCHGDFGEAVGRWPVLAGGTDTLASQRPVKTVGSYWPYLSTVYDYVNRAMPFGDARSLTPDEIYAITAYILYVNDLVDEEFELSKENFTDVKLPNQDNFYMDDRATTELVSFAKKDICMTDCKTSVEITKHATILDVTPDAAAESSDETPAKEASVEEPKVEAAPAVETAAAAPIDEALAKKGKKVFKKCKACHQVGEGAKNRTGPVLNGIVGHVAGGHDGFKYSKAMKQANADGLVWDEEALAAFLTKPKAYMKGTKMTFAGLKREKDIKAIIEYLRSFE